MEGFDDFENVNVLDDDEVEIFGEDEDDEEVPDFESFDDSDNW